MAKEPLGRAAYNGLAVPVEGESETRQEDSSRTIRTLTHSSDNIGRFFTFRDFVPPIHSSRALADVAAIDADGGFLGLQGTSVKMELNSSGLYVDGGKQLFDNSGKKAQVALTAGTTAHTIVSSNAGKIHVISTQAATSVFIYLPSSGSVAVGEVYEFISNTTAASLLNFAILGTNTDGEIQCHLGSTNVVATTKAITHVSSGALWVKFLCLSTAGPTWAASNQLVPTFPPTVAQYLGFAEGTSA